MASSSQVCDCVHEHGWDSAFYRFAETIRDLTCGGCNHKHIYALVGTRGRYINHSNPVVRKRIRAAMQPICSRAMPMTARCSPRPRLR